MAEQSRRPPQKQAPEDLALRATPERVIRFKRSALIGVAAFALIGVSVAVGMGLKTPARTQAQSQEAVNTDHKNAAEGLDKLPANYAQVKSAPKLGDPLPGELGKAVLSQERAYGVLSDSGHGFAQSEEVNQARAERLRLAQQARQAKEASVFFPLSQNRGSSQTSNAASGGGASAGSTYAGGSSEPGLNLDLERDQNGQQRKIDFINSPGQRGIYNPYLLQDAASPYQVMAGSIISASLVTGINSDLPGLVTAQVTENIFDSVSGKYLLIPQGSRVIGSYDSVVAYGQSRALLVWQRIIMPDGSSVQIENLPATDPSGYAGLADKVDFHTWQLLKGVVLSTMLGVGTELTFGNNESDLVRAIEMSTQQNINQAGQRITQKNLNLQPTITIRPGTPLRVIVHKDLILRPFKG